MSSRNQELGLDLEWINSITVSEAVVISTASKFVDKGNVSAHMTEAWLIKAIQAVDLSLLFGNETPDAISQLCHKATHPLKEAEDSLRPKISSVGKEVACAAVCVYPLRVSDCVRALPVPSRGQRVNIAAVAAGFPTGQFPLHTRLAEIYYAVAEGAHEIDIVIDRSLVLRGLWSQLYSEVAQMRRACPRACLKVILSVSECGSLINVYKASVVAMQAGADFIKTSTGKETALMTIHDGLVMCQAIKEFHQRHKVKVGLKPAGGVRTEEQAISWMLMVREVLGEEWLSPHLFRIGTSGTSALVGNLANAILKAY